MSYVATRRVHHDNKQYESGQLIEVDPKSEIHKADIDELVRVGAAKPAEEVAALNAMGVPKLMEIATAEEITIPDGAKRKDQIIAVIVAARAHRGDQEKQPQE